jgi:hypothetical protein
MTLLGLMINFMEPTSISLTLVLQYQYIQAQYVAERVAHWRVGRIATSILVAALAALKAIGRDLRACNVTPTYRSRALDPRTVLL